MNRMVLRMTTPHPSRSRWGFSLVELLLSVVLLMLLLGAVVFNFSTFQQGAQLDEGAMRVEAMIRFAKATASNSGKKVQVRFLKEPSGTHADTTATVKMELMWEPDPLGQPGRFEKLSESQEFVDSAAELVQIKAAQSISSDEMTERVGGLPASSVNSTELDSAVSPTTKHDEARGEENPVEEYGVTPMPTIEFFPDGSSDTAQITLASLDLDDQRLTVIRLNGNTGELRRVSMTEGQDLVRFPLGDADFDDTGLNNTIAASSN